MGRRRAPPVSGNTGKPFDEPTTQKTPALRVALRRAPAASQRSTVFPDTLFARLLADRLAGTQRSWFKLALTCSSLVRRQRLQVGDGFMNVLGAKVPARRLLNRLQTHRLENRILGVG